MEDSLAGDLLRHLYDALGARPRGDVCWVMNHEWFMEIRMLDNHGVAVWEPGRAISGLDLLFGIPVAVQKDAGVPRLVPSKVVAVRSGAGRGSLAFFRVYRAGRLRL